MDPLINTLNTILEDIKSYGTITYQDLKTMYEKYKLPNDPMYKIFVEQLNKHCLDISYKNHNISDITVIPLGTYLRATHIFANKQTIVYVYYNGTIPKNVRFPKHIIQ